MTYEAWRITYQSSEQAARAAWDEAMNLRQDALRYRWLREAEQKHEDSTDDLIEIFEYGAFARLIQATALDAAIDAAMNGANAK